MFTKLCLTFRVCLQLFGVLAKLVVSNAESLTSHMCPIQEAAKGNKPSVSFHRHLFRAELHRVEPMFLVMHPAYRSAHGG